MLTSTADVFPHGMRLYIQEILIVTNEMRTPFLWREV